MDRQAFEELKTRFPGSSWAYWSPEFPEAGCVEEDADQLSAFIESRRDELHPNVVLLSLNPSSERPAGFTNFHSPDGNHYDGRLKAFIQEKGLPALQGAYMTDLVPDIVDADSGNVEPEDADVDRFLEQLDVLEESEYSVLCFTGRTFEALRSYFDADSRETRYNIEYFETTVDGLSLHVYRVWFYGLYGIHQDKADELARQLEYLNDVLETHNG